MKYYSQIANESIEKVQNTTDWLNDFQESNRLFLMPVTL